MKRISEVLVVLPIDSDGKDGESSRMEFTSSSVRQRGNRNKTILMKEMREQLKKKK